MKDHRVIDGYVNLIQSLRLSTSQAEIIRQSEKQINAHKYECNMVIMQFAEDRRATCCERKTNYLILGSKFLIQ